ncbi:MAG: Na/Pi cotransporter family protein [Saccharofermentanales bacterium]|jgi:phosphate:Na+ symporter
MDLFSVLSLVGGLALFLYGMNLMSVGLTRLSGSKLQSILESLTSNRIKGVALGAGITAIIQSSSATTVMLVGLVNAGIIRLRNAIPVIMGANIGTTITAWILSLVGIESSNLLVRMLNPESFTPIMAIVGVIFIMFTQNEKKHNIARILLGFAILMYGMDSMSASVSPLAEVEAFRNLFLLFSNPIIGVLVGAVLTAIIQSSSASVGILQALASTGLVSYGAAIPIILGQNIGTTVTALISSVGANRNARRVAIFHLSFNTIGTCVFLAGFYALNAIFKFSFLNDEIAPVGIAIIHSLFNIFGTIMFLPFVDQMEKLTHKLVPDAEEDRIASQIEERFKLLDERFLETPALAVEQVKKLGSDMIDKTLQGLYAALAMLEDYNHEGFVEVTALEGLVDRYEDRLGTYMVKLSSRELTEYEYKTIAIWLHNISELERMSDHSIHLVHAAAEMHEKKMRFSDNARTELAVYKAALIKCINLAVTALREDDIDIAVQVEPLEEVIDRLNDELTARHIARLTYGDCTLELGFIFSDLVTSMERVADHCSNIAISMIEIHADGLNTHEYLAQVKQDGTGFRKMYESYREEFRLPRDTRIRSNEVTVSLPDNCPRHPLESIETEA